MGNCCGRPNNRAQKGGAAAYYERYAYLSSRQRARQEKLVGTKCKACDALTAGDPCSVCGKPKTTAKEE